MNIHVNIQLIYRTFKICIGKTAFFNDILYLCSGASRIFCWSNHFELCRKEEKKTEEFRQDNDRKENSTVKKVIISLISAAVMIIAEILGNDDELKKW